jgi:hypothetical protein
MLKYFYQILTELIVIFHLIFILFVILGGFFTYRKRWLIIIHLCAVIWGIFVEVSPGIICPLTQYENYFASKAGLKTYHEDFITRYLIPIIYQESLTTNIQYVLAIIVVCINAIAYFILWKRRPIK